MSRFLACLASDGFIAFWTVMIFGSILWYAVLLVAVGRRGGREIGQMVKSLDQAAKRADGASKE